MRPQSRASPSLNPEGFNLDVESHFHFEPIPLTDGDAEVRAVKRADGVSAPHVLLSNRRSSVVGILKRFNIVKLAVINMYGAVWRLFQDVAERRVPS